MPEIAKRIALSEPHREGTVALERCIQQRRSVRGFGEQALAASQLGQLLWAAQGLTGDENKRVVSSAGAFYPLELYVVLGNVMLMPAGVYHYVPVKHELLLRTSGYERERFVHAARHQEWIGTAAAIVCIAAVWQRTTVKYGNRGRGYVFMEAGHAAESLMLQAVALGLATTMVGAFYDDEVKSVFCLNADEVPLALIPIGVP